VHGLVPLPVAVPLAAAAVLGGVGRFLPRRLVDAATIAAAATVAGVSAALVVGSADGPIHYVFGGWHPRGRVVPGIVFSVDPLAGSLAALAGVLTVAGLAFAWHYFDDVAPLFHVLVLCFLAGMVGFALSDDLFNLFVFFELMGIAAFALTGYRIDEPGPLQGALVFGVLNTLAGSLLALGIALVYGRTGALNLVDAGASLAGRPPDALVAVAFALLAAAFLVKAGVPPFHFWLADAYAAAPVPICVLLSGVMSDLGIHAIGRVYAEGFSGAFGGHEEAVRAILVSLGVAGALLAAVMSFLQAELKRLLAYLTASHASIFLAGLALFSPGGLGGTTIWVVADGLAKGALFLAVGVVVHELEDGDELRLRGRGRELPVTAVVFGAGGLLVALLPPFGTFLGFALVDRSASALGYGWLPALLVLASLISGAAVLRAGARVFLGLGDADDSLLSRQLQRAEAEEPGGPSPERPWLGLGPAIALLAAATGLGFAPGLSRHALEAAAHALDRPALVATVFRGAPTPPVHVPPVAISAAQYGYGAVAVAGALALAALGLWRSRLPSALRGAAGRVLGPPVAVLRAAHSGILGEYVTWMTAGTTLLLGLFVAFAR